VCFFSMSIIWFVEVVASKRTRVCIFWSILYASDETMVLRYLFIYDMSDMFCTKVCLYMLQWLHRLPRHCACIIVLRHLTPNHFTHIAHEFVHTTRCSISYQDFQYELMIRARPWQIRAMCQYMIIKYEELQKP